jgi:hypothetical protein
MIAYRPLLQNEHADGMDRAGWINRLRIQHRKVRSGSAGIEQNSAPVARFTQHRPVVLSGFEELSLDHVMPRVPLQEFWNAALEFFKISTHRGRQFANLARIEITQIRPPLAHFLYRCSLCNGREAKQGEQQSNRSKGDDVSPVPPWMRECNAVWKTARAGQPWPPR